MKLANNNTRKVTADKTRATSAFIKNQTITCCATITLDYNEESRLYTIKAEDAVYWDTTSQVWQPLSEDPDKFQYSHEDRDTGFTEFYTHWHMYSMKRFGLHVRLENRTTYFK